MPDGAARALLRRRRTAAACSARTCAARSSSGATTSSRTLRSRASTCCCAATRSCTSHAETQERIVGRFHFALNPIRLSCSSARRRCCSRTPTCSARRPQASPLRQGRRRRDRELRDGVARRRRGVRRTVRELRPRARRPTRSRWPRSCSMPATGVAGDQPGGPRRCSASAPADIGRPLQDLGSPTARSSCAPASSGPQARAPRPVELSEVEWTADAGRGAPALRRPRRPARSPTGNLLGVSIIFVDVTAAHATSSSELERRNERARDGLRGAAVHQRGAGDDQRGAAVHRRGAGDDQRGAPVHQRGAGDDERGAAVHQRGAGDRQRAAARADGEAVTGERLPRGRSSPACASGVSSSTAI